MLICIENFVYHILVGKEKVYIVYCNDIIENFIYQGVIICYWTTPQNSGGPLLAQWAGPLGLWGVVLCSKKKGWVISNLGALRLSLVLFRSLYVGQYLVLYHYIIFTYHNISWYVLLDITHHILIYKAC